MPNSAANNQQAAAERAKAFEPSRAWRALAVAVVAVTVLGLDRITKSIVNNTIAVSGAPVEGIPGLFHFEYVQNFGAAFGMGEGHGMTFVLLAALVLAGTALYLYRARAVSKVETIGLAMVCGGAIGNAIDRVVLGYVTDFIAVSFFDFPVFNVADIGISVGVVVALIGFMFLSPANKVDATAELNRRDEEEARRRAKRNGERARKIRERNERAAAKADQGAKPSHGTASRKKAGGR